MLIGRTDVEDVTPVLWPRCKELTYLKRPWCWERLKAGGEGDNRGWDGRMASPTQWAWVWVGSRSWWWTGRPACWGSWGCKESDMTERLNWTDKRKIPKLYYILNEMYSRTSLKLSWNTEGVLHTAIGTYVQKVYNKLWKEESTL